LLPKIVFLPDAGPENPFQYELMRFLQKHGFEVVTGKKHAIGSTFWAIFQHRPRVLYYDWVHSFIIGQSWWWSACKSLIFLLEVLFAKYLCRIRLVHTLHNLQNHAGLYLSLERVVYGFFLRRCTYVRVYSDTTKTDAVQKFKLLPERVVVVQDLPFHFYYKNQVSGPESRQQLDLPAEAFVYLFFGELKPYKGLDNLLRTFAQTAAPNDLLLIAGKSYDAAYFANLQTLSHPQVRWYHRFIEDQEVQLFFNAADVVVLPFVRIDHSGSADLAMSFGKPVVTLRTPAMLKLLSPQADLLFETPTQLAQCLQNAKKIDRQAVGAQNFATADATNYADILKIFF
jgi:beta-1,4-mannosyltransferase